MTLPQILNLTHFISFGMPRRPSRAVFRSRELDDFLKKLNPNDKRVKWINDMENVLKENMFAGDIIKKDQIPSYYITHYGVNHLYRYSHPEGYRSCYVILDGCPHILDIKSHPEYNKIFGYKKG